MKTPPFLMGAALLFWGWRSGVLAWAFLPALLVELSHFIPLRWEFTLTDLRRIFDLCALLVLAEAVIICSSTGHFSSELSLKFSQWFPIPLFPMLLGQAFGTREKMPLSVFPFLLRRAPESALAKKSVNISYLYFTICLMSAGAFPPESRYFYPGVGFLIGYALWFARPRRSLASTLVWLVLIALVAGIGFAGQRGLRAGQSNLEDALSNWVNLHWRKESDPRESLTAIGRKGRIPMSRKIVLRVTSESSDPLPGLLNEASYSVYTNGIWRADPPNHTVNTSPDNDVITLLPTKKIHFSIRIAKYLRDGSGLLPLPKGAYELRDVPATALLTLNGLGTASFEGAPGLINCAVFYGPGPSIYGHTNLLDWDIPPSETNVLAQIVSDLKLDAKKNESQKIQAIANFFTDFTYSLNSSTPPLDPSEKKTHLGRFLTSTKTGHCEYFATATVLLLRQAGIPARYATGYSIDPSTPSGKTCLVRERDAHAWVLVYCSEHKRWDELDTTPADWRKIENAQTSTWEDISDAWSNLLFDFSKWRYSKTGFLKHLRWLLVPAIAFFVWRILSSKRHKQKLKKPAFLVPLAMPGMDSEFYRIQQQLSAVGMSRMPLELFCDWTRRLSLPNPELLNHIIELHRRLRFDPQGLSAAEREILKREVDRWLAAFAGSTVPKERSELVPQVD